MQDLCVESACSVADPFSSPLYFPMDLPHAMCLVWSCGVLPSFCLRHLVWLVEFVCALCLPSVFDTCSLLSALCHIPCALCCHVGLYHLFCLRHLVWLVEFVCALCLPSVFDTCSLLSASATYHVPCVVMYCFTGQII